MHVNRTLAVGLQAIVASAAVWLSPACGSDAETESETSSTTGGVMCGSKTCQDHDVGGLITLPGCCDELRVDSCGVDLAPAAQLLTVPEGCTELNQPGDPDTSCPAMDFEALGTPVTFDGCCLPTGMCGVRANLPIGGLDFGCLNAGDFSDTPPPAQSCGGGGGAGGSGGANGAGGSGVGGAGGSGGAP